MSAYHMESKKTAVQEILTVRSFKKTGAQKCPNPRKTVMVILFAKYAIVLLSQQALSTFMSITCNRVFGLRQQYERLLTYCEMQKKNVHNQHDNLLSKSPQ